MLNQKELVFKKELLKSRLVWNFCLCFMRFICSFKASSNRSRFWKSSQYLLWLEANQSWYYILGSDLSVMGFCSLFWAKQAILQGLMVTLQLKFYFLHFLTHTYTFFVSLFSASARKPLCLILTLCCQVCSVSEKFLLKWPYINLWLPVQVKIS